MLITVRAVPYMSIRLGELQYCKDYGRYGTDATRAADPGRPSRQPTATFQSMVAIAHLGVIDGDKDLVGALWEAWEGPKANGRANSDFGVGPAYCTSTHTATYSITSDEF